MAHIHIWFLEIGIVIPTPQNTNKEIYGGREIFLNIWNNHLYKWLFIRAIWKRKKKKIQLIYCNKLYCLLSTHGWLSRWWYH